MKSVLGKQLSLTDDKREDKSDSEVTSTLNELQRINNKNNDMGYAQAGYRRDHPKG